MATTTRKNKLPPDTYGRLEALALNWYTAAPYPYFIVCYDPDDDEMMGRMYDCFPLWAKRDPHPQGSATEYHAEDGVKLVLVGVKRGPHWRTTIVHELVHVKNFIADTLGFTHDANNDEPEAYLVGHLFHMTERAFQDLGYGKKSKG